MDADQPAAASATCSPRPTSIVSKVAEEDRFRFTPVALRKAPRLWERKPSTPFQARSKSQKVWKRLLTSFSSMRQSGREQNDAEDELHTEINESANAGFVRGAKRLRLGAGADDDAVFERGRSFLETKWEMEATMKRRKQATKPDDKIDATKAADTVSAVQEPSEANGMEGNDEMDLGESDMKEVPQADDQHVSPTDPGSMDMGSSKDDQAADNPTSTPTKCAQDRSGSRGYIHSPYRPPQTPDATEEDSDVEKLDEVHDDVVAASPNPSCTLQETQSAEKPNSNANELMDDAVEKEITTDETSSGELDGQNSAQDQDTAAAADSKGVMAEQEKSLIRSALRLSELDGEDAELLNDFLARAKAKREANAALTPRETDKALHALISESPTPRARRALEVVDGNSPSPQKVSPSKAGSSPDLNVEAEKVEDQHPATCRRSSRTRGTKQQQQATAPAVPTNIPLRRATGTEFVFLQRTEAQQLALTTRRNTRRNKGDAQLPKVALQALTQQPAEQATESSTGERPSQRRSKRAGGKQVSWNEQRLVEYAHDDVAPAAGARHVEPAPAASRRVAKPSTVAPASPVGKRKKLTPKSPSSALLGTPASKAGRSARSSSILNAGAGSTPMPRRVRARK